MSPPTVSRTAALQRAHLARELVETLVFVGLVFLIVHLTMQSYPIPDSTMAPQLQPGQFVVVNKQAYLFGGPSRGDIVVFYRPDNPSRLLIRRVIGVPGDIITLTATQVFVNGVALAEPYIQVPYGEAQNSVIVPSLTLGPNQYFLLGDDRLDSSTSDSRAFGPVPRSNIVGKAVLVFWPLKQAHWLDAYTGVFAHVPSK